MNNQDIAITNFGKAWESKLNVQQKISATLGSLGLLILFLAFLNVNLPNHTLMLSLSLLSMIIGVSWYSVATYLNHPEGIQNNGVWFKSLTNRGLWAWVWGIIITAFYIILYFYAELLGLNADGANTGVVALFDPLSYFLSGRPASQWFVYGTLYTVAILAFGVKFLLKYRHNRYHQLRTVSVMFFQTAFAFIIPEIMARLNGEIPYYDLKNMWPLSYYNFDQYRIDGFINSGSIGIALLLFGILSIFVISPILTYFYGKRWYCSWVCGCGGLAETAGDPFRHLSDKSQFAWKVERWVIHGVLVFSVVMTTAVVYSYLGNDSSKYWLNKDAFLLGVGFILTLVFGLIFIFKRDALQKDAQYGAIGFFVIILSLIAIHYLTGSQLFLFGSYQLKSVYGFLIGAVFSGVIGVGFYPILGSRVWCRFGCPMAAILGLQQKLFSRFRITTNNDQCISCGNCSTFCEMGIDVRAYAQKQENIVRASCVGCGVCAAVCPRGVLKLENGPVESRFEKDEINFAELLKNQN